jgi:regulator of sigma D
MAGKPVSATLQDVTNFFYGTVDQNGVPLTQAKLDKLGAALYDMNQGTGPVAAMNKVLLPDWIIDKSQVINEIEKMFDVAPPKDWTGKIQVRETLVYFTAKLGDYHSKGEVTLDQKPPDPWGGL